jgi:hypothetical protein
MAITFRVDDVSPAFAPLPRRSEGLAERIGGKPLVQSEDAHLLVEVGDTHALALAVHHAFFEHYPLVLTPDALWLTLAQGFALHVTRNHEELRSRLVRHEGKKTLVVEAASISSREDWERTLAGFSASLQDEVGKGLVNLLTCSFSTTTPASRTASQIVLMDTFQRYFDYEVVCICGIPEITLEGTPEDFRDIRRRVEVMAEYGLDWWAEKLLPVVDQWIATAEGRPDVDFWQCIYKPKEIYGGHVVSGWLVRLFPYLGEGENLRRNAFAPAPESEEDEVAEATGDLMQRLGLRKKTPPPSAPPRARSEWFHEGIVPSSFPPGLSRVPIRMRGVGGEQARVAIAGLLGVGQDEKTLALFPRIGWAVREDAVEEVWERLRQKHAMEPPTGEMFGEELVPATLVAFYGSFGGGSLHGGLVRVLPPEKLGSLPIESDPHVHAVCFAQLTDGTCLAYVRMPRHGDKAYWVVRVDARKPSARNAAVVARSLLELFQRLADEDTPYFLAPGYRPHGTLAQAFT